MELATISTRALGKMLDAAAAGSAEHAAIRKELNARGEGVSRTDKRTPILFGKQIWNSMARNR